MDNLNFYKYQALGNDYIVLDLIKDKEKYNFPEISKKFCERKFNIGADGILLILKSDLADYKMIIFNSDGSRAKMCGNGLRCICLYIYKHIKKKKGYKIETDSGIKTVKFLEVNNKTGLFKISMGKAKENNNILTNPNTEKIILYNNKYYKFYLISIGNPHCIIFVENIDFFDLNSLVKILLKKKLFSDSLNISIVSILKKDKLKYRVYERGVGETLSCGTASAAISFLSNKLGKTDNNITVEQKGGILTVEIINDEIFLTGTTEEIYKGEI